jgi:predicted acyl esterase
MDVASFPFRALLLFGFTCAALMANGETPAPPKLYRDVIRQQDLMIAARDGVLLATDVYRPAAGNVAAPERLPVLLHRTPYDKSEAAAVAIAETLAKHG